MIFKTILIAGTGLPISAGIIATILFGKKRDISKPPGLLFHSILPGSILPNLSCLSKVQFSKTMHHLKSAEFNPITTNNSVCHTTQPETKRILITFDDGFQSVFDHALPVLEEVNFKASIFCVTDYIGKSSTWDVYGNSNHLDKNSILRLSELGHEIGSHTCTHANLPYLSEKDLTKELYDSKARLQDITGRAVTSLSFPFGSWNKRVWGKAREVGYVSATLYRNHSCSFDSHLFPVHGVYQFDSLESIISKIDTSRTYSISSAISLLLSHFSKGTPLWKFRKNYQLFPN
jgi:peptidoglycan/xylan/chitin deacetylase (PgdA/CDA1 family)